MIDLRILEELVAFHDTGTLSAAAQQLHTSQPALTRSMKKLEEELGVTLFLRSRNRMQLNETGKIAAEYAARVLKEEQYFEERIISYDRSLHTINIGFCAPIPQIVLTPVINNIFGGMTISADMTDDKEFLRKLENRTYQLVVTHKEPEGNQFCAKKCGHEDLFISLLPSDPLTFYPEIHLKDLDGRSILLLDRIGFWRNITKEKTPRTHFLLQVERDTFEELAQNSDYPSFSSSYYMRRNQTVPGRVNVALADEECHTDYFLVCLKSEEKRFTRLFSSVHGNTVY